MDVIGFITGTFLLIVLILDVYSTVFVPRGEAGLISRRLYSKAWSLCRRFVDRLPDKKRRFWLSQIGPILVPLTVVLWGLLLVISFALIYAPWVEEFSISPPESGPMSDWAVALYYSGYSAVTLGVGDVVPNGTVPRLLAVTEAGFGFALFTVSVTYLLSVYSARNQSTALALAISRFVGRGEGKKPRSLLIAVARSEGAEGVGAWLGRMAFDLATLVELRGQYPLLHYFHEPNDDRAMPIALSDLLELITLCRSLLDSEKYPALANGPTITAVQRLGRHYLSDFDSAGLDDGVDFENARRARRERYIATRELLTEAGVAMRDNGEAWSIYEAIAREWDIADEGMRTWLGYRSEWGAAAQSTRDR